MTNLSISLSLFLDILWRHQDCSIVPEHLGLQIKSLDPEENLCHVGKEWREQKPLGAGLMAVWRKKDWELDILNYNRQKAESETRILLHEKNKELMGRLMVGIQDAIGITEGSENMAMVLAGKIRNIKQRDKLLEAIRQFVPDLKDEELI